MKNKGLIITILIILVVVSLVYFLFFREKTETAETTIEKPKDIKAVVKKTTATVSVKFPLKLKSEGDAITNVQRYINHYGPFKIKDFQAIKENGYFGQDTEINIKKLWNTKEVSKSLYNNIVFPFIKDNF